MKRFIAGAAVMAAFLGATPSYSQASLEERVAALETEVAALKLNRNTDGCPNFTAQGGLIGTSAPAGKDAKGQWYRTNYSFKANFEFEIKGRTAAADGSEILYVRLNSPGYSPSCTTEAFFASDVIVYQ